MSSLPVPLSPRITTGVSEPAKSVTRRRSSTIGALAPLRSASCPRRASACQKARSRLSAAASKNRFSARSRLCAVIGLTRKSAAPARTTCTAWSIDPKAVSTITGQYSRSSGRKVIPSASGRRMSRIASSGWNPASAVKASARDSTPLGAWPRRCSWSQSSRFSVLSSSMTRMRRGAGWVMPSSLPARAAAGCPGRAGTR